MEQNVKNVKKLAPKKENRLTGRSQMPKKAQFMTFFDVLLSARKWVYHFWMLPRNLHKMFRPSVHQSVRPSPASYLWGSNPERAMTFCIHGLFYILNRLGTVDILRNDHGAVKCTKYAAKFAKGDESDLVFYFQIQFTGCAKLSALVKCSCMRSYLILYAATQKYLSSYLHLGTVHVIIPS